MQQHEKYQLALHSAFTFFCDSFNENADLIALRDKLERHCDTHPECCFITRQADLCVSLAPEFKQMPNAEFIKLFKKLVDNNIDLLDSIEE